MFGDCHVLIADGEKRKFHSPKKKYQSYNLLWLRISGSSEQYIQNRSGDRWTIEMNSFGHLSESKLLI